MRSFQRQPWLLPSIKKKAKHTSTFICKVKHRISYIRITLPKLLHGQLQHFSLFPSRLMASENPYSNLWIARYSAYTKELYTVHCFREYVDSYKLQSFLGTHHEHLPSPLSFRDGISTGHRVSTQSSNWSTCRFGSEFTHSSRNSTSSVALWVSVPTIALL